MKNFLLFVFTMIAVRAGAQDSAGTASQRIIIIPCQSMMYFSDADADMARSSKLTEPQVRNAMRTNLDANIHHQLLGSFDAISLMRATSLEGEEDLTRIYRATRYGLYTPEMREDFEKQSEASESDRKKRAKKRRDLLGKDASFSLSDSGVMLAMIMDPELLKHLNKKYNEKYILYITQFEVNTNNKNTIEWMKQQYQHSYVVHYNLLDRTGRLIWAETLTLKGGPENNVKEINDRYLIKLADRIKVLLVAEYK